MKRSKILFLSATHGDEGFSSSVLEKIELNYPKNKYNYDWIIANEKALKNNTRFQNVDLNRCAPGDLNSPLYEERRAAEIINLSKNFDFIIDLHGSVSNVGVITIITHPTLQNIFLSSLVKVENHVIWYTKSSLVKGPLTQYCHCPAIEIECGPKKNPEIQQKLYDVIESILVTKEDLSINHILDRAKKINLFSVYGKNVGQPVKKMNDFIEYEDINEKYYPFLSNQYPNIACYKMKKIEVENLFLN